MFIKMTKAVFLISVQVKTYYINSDGKDVIFHMIDNFAL